MVVHSKIMLGAGIAIAGLGLIGAGAGATFTAQVSAGTTISTGGLGFSLNGKTGSDVSLGVDGKSISSHFAPISKDLRLKNTGTLDMASTYLDVTATGCEGGEAAPLAQALRLTVQDVTNDRAIYKGNLCSFAIGKGDPKDSNKNAHNPVSKSGDSSTAPAHHAGVGGRLPQTLAAGDSILYRIVIEPSDAQDGLPTAAQFTKTSVNLVFSGFDY